jgi:phospholipase/carboxylesterase
MDIQALDCEFVPARQTDSHKLLVVLHGRGDSAAGFRWLPEALALPGLSYLLVNAPDPYFGGRSWYDFPPDQEAGALRSRGLLEQLFAELAEAGWGPEDLALFGFSQGCLMTLEFGSRSPLELACYVGMSGYCLDVPTLLAEMSPAARRAVWLVTHGRSDEVLPFAHSEQQMQALRAGGLPLQFCAYDKGHTVDLQDELSDLRDFLVKHLMELAN